MLGIYTRISREDKNEEGISLANQRSRGIDLANKLKISYKVYEDAGKSGSLPIENRPAFLQLFKDIESKAVTTVYVLNQSRLDRGNLLQFLTIIRFLRESKIALYYNHERYDYTNLNTELTMNLLAVVNNNYVRQTSENIKSALHQNMLDGKVNGGPLKNYGYTKGEDKKLIIDPEESQWVEEMYKLALEGKGTKVIANYLNDRGVPTKRMKASTGRGMMVKDQMKTDFTWRDSVVYRILTNPLYKGVRYYQGKVYTAPAIIEEVVFDLLQEQLVFRNKFKDTTNKYQYLLKGLIRCPICRSKVQGKKRANGKDNCYTCTSNRYGPNCGNRGINIEYLNKLITDSVLDLENIITEAFSDSELQSRTMNFKKELVRVEEKIKEIEAQERTLIKLALQTNNNIAVATELNILQHVKEGQLRLKEASKKEIAISQEKEKLIALANEGVKDFKRAKGFNEKANFLRNIISLITVKWVDEEDAYDVSITFKINQLQSYLITKELMINRTGRKSGRAVSKILSEKITIKTLTNVDPKEGVQFVEPLIHYSNFFENHIPGPVTYVLPNNSDNE